SKPARQRLTRKGFLPDFGELGRELVLGNPVHQVAHVQVSPVNLQQHPNIGSVEDTPGEQLVDDQIFTAEHKNLDIQARHCSPDLSPQSFSLVRGIREQEIDLNIQETPGR